MIFTVHRKEEGRNSRVFGKLKYDVLAFYDSSEVQLTETEMESARSVPPVLLIEWQMQKEGTSEKPIILEESNGDISQSSHNISECDEIDAQENSALGKKVHGDFQKILIRI
jgi:hypothetical protein